MKNPIVSNAVYQSTLTPAQRLSLLWEKLEQAIREENWESVSAVITLNAEIMSEALERAYPLLPAEYQFSIPVECYTHHGDSQPTVRKYVRQARKLLPAEQRVPAELLALPQVTIYRAGEEPITQAANSISWTTSSKVAQWFYERATYYGAPRRHLYRGVIRPEKIIWYTVDSQEQEVMQYRNVKEIMEITPDKGEEEK